MEAPQLERSKVQIPFAIVDFLEPNIFSAEDVAHVDPMGLPADAAVGAHEADLKVVGVLERGEARGPASWRGPIARGGCVIAQGLVRALVVELQAEGGRSAGAWRAR